MLKSKSIIYACSETLARDGTGEVLAVVSHDHDLPFLAILRHAPVYGASLRLVQHSRAALQDYPIKGLML